jgi:hypothetical protein
MPPLVLSDDEVQQPLDAEPSIALPPLAASHPYAALPLGN